MKLLISILFCFTGFWGFSQTDTVATSDGNLMITPILHATMVLEWNDKTIFVDPYGGAEKFTDFPDPDLILISDIHGDHLNKETLEALNLENAELIAPQAVIDQLGDVTFAKTWSLGNGNEMSWMKMKVQAIPMYNLPETADSRHPKGRGNGYVLTMGDKRIYISGDTEDIPEMRALEDIDIAFVCMNLPYTMDINQAADAVLEFRPKVVYPFHYRGSEGLSDVESFQMMVSKSNPDIEVRLRQWYPQ